MEKEEIINEQNIINTYPERNKEFATTYLEYLQIKKENPTLGYKRLSKLLNKPIHATRCWHHTNSVPEPINTVNWLKGKKLIPLTTKNDKIKLIAKIAGATFSDGGIFENLIFTPDVNLPAQKSTTFKKSSPFL